MPDFAWSFKIVFFINSSLFFLLIFEQQARNFVQINHYSAVWETRRNRLSLIFADRLFLACFKQVQWLRQELRGFWIEHSFWCGRSCGFALEGLGFGFWRPVQLGHCLLDSRNLQRKWRRHWTHIGMGRRCG